MALPAPSELEGYVVGPVGLSCAWWVHGLTVQERRSWTASTTVAAPYLLRSNSSDGREILQQVRIVPTARRGWRVGMRAITSRDVS